MNKDDLSYKEQVDIVVNNSIVATIYKIARLYTGREQARDIAIDSYYALSFYIIQRN
jgi:hypothetical protein